MDYFCGRDNSFRTHRQYSGIIAADSGARCFRQCSSGIEASYEEVIRDAVEPMAATGVTVLTDGESRKYHNLRTHSVERVVELQVGNFYISLQGAKNGKSVREFIGTSTKPDQWFFGGVPALIGAHIETPAEVRDQVPEAVAHIPADQPGTNDDCSFTAFFEDLSTFLDATFAKIPARINETLLAAAQING